jgi:hypothetical protein
MRNLAIWKIAVGMLSVGFMAVAGIASAGDWHRPLVHAQVRVVIGIPACPAPVYVAPCRPTVIVPEVVIGRERFDHRDRFDRRWR